MKFVYILVGFTRECLNRQTAAGLPSQQLINNSAFSDSVCVVCARARHVKCAPGCRAQKEDVIYCWQSRKVQSSKFKKDAVFIHPMRFYLAYFLE